MKKIINLSLTDFKLIFRDSSLKPFLFLPLILFGLILWGVPPLIEKYEFLEPYLFLFLVVAVIENTQTFSFISSMVLIDEKETDVAKVYGVVPLTKFEYLISRFLIPYFFTVLLNVILFIVQPFFEIGLLTNVLTALLAALVVPVYVLSINSIAKNRIQGMIYIKAFNMLVLLPIAAFFVPENFKHFFGILPTHWIFQSVEAITQNSTITVTLGIGYLFFSILIYITSKLFISKHFT
jgi:fluoroquinolone transport system permease protein